MIRVRTVDGHTWHIKVPEGVSLADIHHSFLNNEGAWPESQHGEWFINPRHIIAINEVKE